MSAHQTIPMCLASCLIVLLILTGRVRAEVYEVPETYPTINFAISAASADGSWHDDIVLVNDGEYQERLQFSTSIVGKLIVQSVNGPAKTKINASGGPVVYQGSNQNPQLRGFRIINSYAGNSAVYMWGNWSIELVDCVIKKEDNPSASWAVHTYGAYGTSLNSCTVEGFGLRAGFTSSIYVYSSRIINGGVSYYCSGSTQFRTQDTYYCGAGNPLEQICSKANVDMGGNIVVESCDCDENGLLDIEDVESNPLLDCNRNLIPDICDIDSELEDDCNGNQIPDPCEVENGTVADINQDGVPDSCQCICDLNADGIVDAADLGILLAIWDDPKLLPSGDINADGNIDAADLGLLLGYWGVCQ